MSARKLKKRTDETAPAIRLVGNPDILATLAHARARPALVIGFAAETENLVAFAQEKRRRKGCDWILANDVRPETGNMGGSENRVHLVTAAGVEDWPQMSKADVARRLVAHIAQTLAHSAA
jgi:phosphopantothenoylcysteine decarboxylase/phosphopantothenate--cysteine ligase